MVSALCVEKLFLKKFLRWLLYHTEETQNMVCQVFLKPLNKLFSAHQQQMLCPMWRHAKKKKVCDKRMERGKSYFTNNVISNEKIDSY